MFIKYIHCFVFLGIFIIINLNNYCQGTSNQGCINVKGIGNDPNIDIYTIEDLINAPTSPLQLFGALITTARANDIGVIFEPSITFHVELFTFIRWYNILSYFDKVALEIWNRPGHINQRRRCQPDINDNDQVLLFKLHKNVAMAYGLYFQFRDFYNIVTATDYYIENYMNVWGLDPFICDTPNSCNDISTPWGIANIVNNEMLRWLTHDGWNKDGSYNRGFNRIPYSDYRDDETRYIPKNNPWNLEFIENWQPLLESDELGFLFHQEHVSPHIGYTAKSFFFSDDEICQHSINFKENYGPDDYDYNIEMDLTFDRLANLNDEIKMEVELFDNKTPSLALSFIQARSRFGTNPESLEYIAASVVNAIITYEAVIRVWKEKVDFDRVRPTSIVHKLLGDQLITSYAGTTPDGATLGTQTLKGNNWEPYIRTMPHSEYPSASACLCRAWADAMIEWFGTDDISGLDGMDTPITLRSPAFSSLNEPLTTPANDIIFEFSSFSEISNRCGQSRLDGGMHFTQSVPDGAALCGNNSNIGKRVSQSIRNLLNGISPEFIVDFNNINRIERDCYPNENGSGMIPTGKPTIEPTEEN